MDKAITTSFMIVISIVVSVMVFNTVYPAVRQGTDSLVSMSARMDERLKSQIKIIHATGELNSSGAWQDGNGDGHFNAFVWVKNVGSSRIAAINGVDVFFGPEGDFTRIPYVDNAGGIYPYWDLTVENDAQWGPTATARITVHYAGPLSSGRYFVKVVIPSGVEDNAFLGL